MVAEIGADMSASPALRIFRAGPACVPAIMRAWASAAAARPAEAIAGYAPRWWEAGGAAGRHQAHRPWSTLSSPARTRRAWRAVLAVGRNILEIAYHLLSEQTIYRELGIDCFDRYRTND